MDILQQAKQIVVDAQSERNSTIIECLKLIDEIRFLAEIVNINNAAIPLLLDKIRDINNIFQRLKIHCRIPTPDFKIQEIR